MLDDRFAGTAIVSMQGHIASTTQDKAETCESRHEQYAIHSITISPDRRSATVEISTSLDVGGTIMQIRSHSKDTLVRQNGLVRMQHDAHGSVNMGHEKGAVPPLSSTAPVPAHGVAPASTTHQKRVSSTGLGVAWKPEGMAIFVPSILVW